MRQRVAEDREIVQVRAPTAAEAIRARCRCIRRCSRNGASIVPARAGPGPPVLTCAVHRPRVARVWYLQLFDSRQHPLGGRPGVDDNSRELPFFEPRAVQLEAKLKHGARNPSCRRVAHIVPGDASPTGVSTLTQTSFPGDLDRSSAVGESHAQVYLPSQPPHCQGLHRRRSVRPKTLTRCPSLSVALSPSSLDCLRLLPLVTNPGML